MTSPDRTPSLAEYLEGLRAESLLAALDLHADLADLHDTETCPRLRQSFAERYRHLVGVLPRQRNALRSGLERIRAGGGMAVADLVATLVRSHENGTSGGTGA